MCDYVNMERKTCEYTVIEFIIALRNMISTVANTIVSSLIANLQKLIFF